MTNVREPFSFDLNWNPSYSYCEIPVDYTGEVPDHWKVLSAPVSKEQGMPEFEGLDIADVKASLTPDYTGKSYAFLINAYPEKPIRDVRMKNIAIQAYEFWIHLPHRGLGTGSCVRRCVSELTSVRGRSSGSRTLRRCSHEF